LEGERLDFRAVSGVGLQFEQGTGEQLLRVLESQSFEPDVVIIETFRRVLVGSENEAEHVARFWRLIDVLVRAGKTVIVSHHMKKPSPEGRNDNRNRASGSTDIIAGADAAVAVERDGRGTVVLECTKSRDGEEPPRFAVTLDMEAPDDDSSPASLQ